MSDPRAYTCLRCGGTVVRIDRPEDPLLCNACVSELRAALEAAP
jgi:hypothetical protein